MSLVKIKSLKSPCADIPRELSRAFDDHEQQIGYFNPYLVAAMGLVNLQRYIVNSEPDSPAGDMRSKEEMLTLLFIIETLGAILEDLGVPSYAELQELAVLAHDIIGSQYVWEEDPL